MKRYFHKFNVYLALVPLLWAAGCASESSKYEKMEQSTIRLYLEGSRADVTGTGTVQVTRSHYPYVVEREPFVTEADLRSVQMVNEPGPNGGYFIELDFDDHGTLALEMSTTLHRGGHIIVFSQFPPKGYKPPKASTKGRKSDDDEAMQLHEPLPQEHPEFESPDKPRTAAWLAAVLVRERNPTGRFRFSPDASREETARIVRGLRNVIAYEKLLSQNK